MSQLKIFAYPSVRWVQTNYEGETIYYMQKMKELYNQKRTRRVVKNNDAYL